jgi:hypothetical protein
MPLQNSQIMMRYLNIFLEQFFLSLFTQNVDPDSMALAKVVHMNNMTPCKMLVLGI